MLDKVNGELIEGLGRDFVIAPLSKWADTPMWREATERAQLAFRKKGALLPIVIHEDDVLIQEYPSQSRLAFVFHRKVAGRSVYLPVVMLLDDRTVSGLQMAGRWRMSKTKH